MNCPYSEYVNRISFVGFDMRYVDRVVGNREKKKT